MPEPAQIVADIMGFLDGRTAKAPQELSALASSFAMMAKETNGRLGTCADYLHRRLPVEAVYHASIPPDLLEMTRTLNFPRISDWNAVCAERKLEVGPMLMADVAGELVKAHTVAMSLNGLLTRMRLMSLAPHPVRDRLDVLRKMVKVDPSNTGFVDDVRAFEAARFHEIAKEAKDASETNELETLQKLLDELRSEQWTAQVPAKLMEDVTKHARQIQLKSGAELMTALYPDLQSAYAAKSYEECKALMDQWNELLKTYRVSSLPSLQPQIRSIAQWVEQIGQQRREASMAAEAVANLDANIQDTRGSLDQLIELHGQACSLGETLPEDLEQRYQATLASRRSARHRKIVLRISLAAVIVLALLTVGGWLFYRSIRDDQAANLARELNAAVGAATSSKELDAALAKADSVKKSDPALCQHRLVQEAIAAVGERKSELERQASRFDQLLEQAQTQLAMRMFGEARNSLDEAGKLVQTEEQGNHLQKAQNEVNQADKEKLEKDRVAYQGKVRDLEAKIQDIANSLDQVPHPSRDTNISSIETQLNSIAVKWKTVWSDNHQDLEAGQQRDALAYKDAISKKEELDKAIKARSEELKESNEYMTALTALLDKVSLSPAEYAKELETFADKLKDDSRKKAIKDVSAQWTDWQAVEDWIALAGEWKPFLPLPEGATEVSKRLVLVDQYLKKYPSSPFRKDVEELAAYIKKAKMAVDKDDSPYLRSIDGVMKIKCLDRWHFVVSKAGDKVGYYCPPDTTPKPFGNNDHLEIRFHASMDTEKTTVLNIEKQLLVADPEPSPSAILAKAVRKKVASINAATWDTMALELLQMIKDDTSVDPVFRAFMIDQVLTQLTEAEATWGLTDDLAKVASSLKSLNLTKVNLFAPPNDDVEEAKKALSNMPGFIKSGGSGSTMETKLFQERDKLAESLTMKFKGNGFFLKDTPEGAVKTRVPLGEKNSFWVVKDDRAGKKKLVEIGSFIGGRQVFNDDSSGIQEGTMVFIR